MNKKMEKMTKILKSDLIEWTSQALTEVPDIIMKALFVKYLDPLYKRLRKQSPSESSCEY